MTKVNEADAELSGEMFNLLSKFSDETIEEYEKA